VASPCTAATACGCAPITSSSPPATRASLWLKQRVARNRSSYAFITDPLDASSLRARADTMVWESARRYLYLRSTGDGRLLVGGEDDAIDIPSRRDARVEMKAARLVSKVAKAMPGLALTPAFAWAGTFAETEDGLPFFGPHAQYGPRLQFAMAYGGNGITCSMLGAGLIRALIERRKHPLAALFSFRRLKC
jgi:glycine/D-amino acid oxidase-like deaminating enzyme